MSDGKLVCHSNGHLSHSGPWTFTEKFYSWNGDDYASGAYDVEESYSYSAGHGWSVVGGDCCVIRTDLEDSAEGDIPEGGAHHDGCGDKDCSYRQYCEATRDIYLKESKTITISMEGEIEDENDSANYSGGLIDLDYCEFTIDEGEASELSISYQGSNGGNACTMKSESDTDNDSFSAGVHTVKCLLDTGDPFFHNSAYNKYTISFS